MPKNNNSNNNSNNNVRKLNAKWLNNSLKSIGLMSVDVLNNLAPFTKPTIQSLYETGSATIKDLRTGKNVTNRVADALSKNAIINDGKKMFSNALKDIKSGKFYNDDRQNEALENSFGMNDNEDVSFGDMDEETPSVTINNYRNDTDSSQATISIMEKSIEQNTKNAETLNNTMIATSSSILLQNSKIGNDILNTLDSINTNIGSILNFYQNDMKTLVESSTSFFNTMLENKDESNADNKVKFRDVTSNGFDVGTYVNYVKQNFNKVISNHEVLSLLNDSMIRESLVSNPIGTILPLVLTEAIPKTIKDSFSLIDNSIKESIVSSFNKLGNWGNGEEGLTGELKKIFAEIFGTKTDMKGGFNTEREIDESPVKFNNLTNTTIVEVIPKYLRESTEYLRIIATAVSLNDDNTISEGILNNTGAIKSWAQNNAEIMDLSTGLFKTMKDMKEFLSESFTDYIHNNVNNRSNRLFDELNKANEANETDKKLDYEELANLYEAISGIMGTANSKLNMTTDEILAKLNESKNSNARGRITDKQLDLLETVISSGVVDNDNINYARIGGTDIINRAIEALAGNSNIRYYKDINDPRDLLREKYGAVYNDDSPSAAEQIRQDRHRRDTFSNMFDMGRSTVREVYDKFTEGARGTVLEPIVNGIAAVGTIIADGFKEYIWDPLTIKLFGTKNDAGYREDGIFSNLYNSVVDVGKKIHFTITGDSYTDRDGVLHEDDTGESSLLGRLKKSFHNLLYGDSEAKLAENAELRDLGFKVEDNKGLIGGFKENFEKLTNGFFKAIHNWKIALTGSDEETSVDVGKEISKDLLDKGITTGIDTGIGGIIGSLFGGPVVGSIIGLSTGIISQSENARTLIFGKDAEFDEEGNIVSNEVDGIISKATQKFFSENGIKMAVGAVGGGVLGTIIGGPVLGAGLALAGSILNGSGIFNRFLFGDEEEGREGILDAWNRVQNRFFKNNSEEGEESEPSKLLGMSAIGAGFGGLIGTLFGPYGALGGAVLGFSASVLAQKKNFSEWLFGKDQEIDGKIVHKHGILGQMANTIKVNLIEPIVNTGKYLVEDFKIFVEHDILDPIKHSLEPVLTGLIQGVFRTFGFVSENITNIYDYIKNDFLQNIIEITGKVLSPITDAATYVGKSLYNLGKTVVSLPFKLLETIGNPIGKIVGGFAKATGTVLNTVIVKPLSFVMKTLGKAAEVASKVITAPFKLIKIVTDKIMAPINHIGRFLGEIVKDGVKGVGRWFDNVFVQPIRESFRMAGQAIVDVGKTAIGMLAQTGKSVMKAVGRGVNNIFVGIGKSISEFLFGNSEKDGLLGGVGKRISNFISNREGDGSVIGRVGGYLKSKWLATGRNTIDENYNPEEHTAAENDRHAKETKIKKNRLKDEYRKFQNSNSKLINKYTKGQLTEDTEENRRIAEEMSGRELKWKDTSDSRFDVIRNEVSPQFLEAGELSRKADNAVVDIKEYVQNIAEYFRTGKFPGSSNDAKSDVEEKLNKSSEALKNSVMSGDSPASSNDANKDFINSWGDYLDESFRGVGFFGGVKNLFKTGARGIRELWNYGGTVNEKYGDMVTNIEEDIGRYITDRDYRRGLRGFYNREGSVAHKRNEENQHELHRDTKFSPAILLELKSKLPGKEVKYNNKSGHYQYKDADGKWVDVPGYAVGTDDAQEGPAIVGEHGPEIVNLHDGDQVITNDNTKNIGNSLSKTSNALGKILEKFTNISDRFNDLVNVLGDISGTLKGDGGNKLNRLVPNLNIPHAEEDNDNNETTEAAQIAEMSDGASINTSAIGADLFSDSDNFDGTYANMKAFNEAKEDDEINRKAQIAEIESNEKMNKLVDGEEKKETFFDKIIGFGSGLFNLFSGLFSGGWGGLLGALGIGIGGVGLLDSITDGGFSNFVGGIFEKIGSAVSQWWNGNGDNDPNAGKTMVKNAIHEVAIDIIDSIKGIGDWIITDGIPMVVETIKTSIGGISDFIHDVFNGKDRTNGGSGKDEFDRILTEYGNGNFYFLDREGNTTALSETLPRTIRGTILNNNSVVGGLAYKGLTKLSGLAAEEAAANAYRDSLIKDYIANDPKREFFYKTPIGKKIYERKFNKYVGKNYSEVADFKNSMYNTATDTADDLVDEGSAIISNTADNAANAFTQKQGFAALNYTKDDVANKFREDLFKNTGSSLDPISKYGITKEGSAVISNTVDNAADDLAGKLAENTAKAAAEEGVKDTVIKKAMTEISDSSSMFVTNSIDNVAEAATKSGGILDKVKGYLDDFSNLLTKQINLKFPKIKVNLGEFGPVKFFKKIQEKSNAFIEEWTKKLGLSTSKQFFALAFMAWGALDGASAAAKLFHVDKPDNTMILVSTIFGAIKNAPVVSWIALIFDIMSALTGVDIWKGLATVVYNLLNPGNAEIMQQQQAEFQERYQEYIGESIQKEYETRKSAGIIGQDVTYEQFKQGVEDGTYTVSYKSEADFNVQEHHSLNDDIGSSLGKTAKSVMESTIINKNATGTDSEGNTYKKNKDGTYSKYDAEGNLIAEGLSKEALDSIGVEFKDKKKILAHTFDAVIGGLGEAIQGITKAIGLINKGDAAELCKMVAEPYDDNAGEGNEGAGVGKVIGQFLGKTVAGLGIVPAVLSWCINTLTGEDNLIGSVFSVIGNTVSGIFGGVSSLLSGAVNSVAACAKGDLVGLWKDGWSDIDEGSSDGESVGLLVGNIGVGVINSLMTIPTAISWILHKAFEGIGPLFNTFKEGMDTTVEGGKNALEALAEGDPVKLWTGGFKNLNQSNSGEELVGGILGNIGVGIINTVLTIPTGVSWIIHKVAEGVGSAIDYVTDKWKDVEKGFTYMWEHTFGFLGKTFEGIVEATDILDDSTKNMNDDLYTQAGGGVKGFTAAMGGTFIDFFTGGNASKSMGWGEGVEASGGFGGETMGVYYSQKDPRWANNRYQRSDGSDDGADMSSAGCGPAAVAMTLSDMGNNVTPTDIAKDVTNSGYRDYTGTNANYIQKAANDYNLSSIRISNPSSDMIKNQLNSGNPVILQGKGSDTYTKAGHYVVATGYDGNDIYINDPRGKKYSGKRNINSFINNTYNSWSFGRGGYGYDDDINLAYQVADGETDNSNSIYSHNKNYKPKNTSKFKDIKVNAVLYKHNNTNGNAVVSSTSKMTNSDRAKIRASLNKIKNNGIDKYYYPVKFKNKAKYGDNIWPTQAELDHYLDEIKKVVPNWAGINNFIQTIAPIPNDGSVPRPSNTNNIASSTGAVINGLNLGWVDVVKAVKKAIAEQKVGYSQSNYIKINLGRELSVRTDCSGFVRACVDYYGYDKIGNLWTGNMLSDSSELKTLAGFTRRSWTGWDDLNEGDIIVNDHHTEIFSKNENGRHYVWNCGDDSSCNTPEETTDTASYTTVWTPGPPGPNPIPGVTAKEGFSSALSKGSSNKQSLLSRIASGIGKVANTLFDAMLTGNWDIDWSSVLSDNSSTSSGGDANVSVDWNSSDNAKKVYSFFRSKGYSPAAAAGILGNMYQESGIDPTKVQGNGAGPAAGIVQWENYNTKSARWKAMADYNKSRGKDWTDLQGQLEFVDKELSDSSMDPFWNNTVNVEGRNVGPSSYEDFKKSNDVTGATYQFEKTFERAGTPNMSTRITKANEYYNAYKNMGASNSGGFGEFDNTSDIKKISYYNSPEYINKKKQETIDRNKREALKQLSRQMLKNRNGNIITKTKNNNETIKVEQGHSFTVGQDTYHFINTTTTNDNMEAMFGKMIELLSNISENSNSFKDIKDLKSNMNVTNTYVNNQTGKTPNVQKTSSVNKVFSNEESARKIAYGY